MPRRVLGTMLVLCLIAAGLGLRAGWRHATMTETEAIEAAAADYVAFEAARGHAAEPTECSARPARAAWLIVTCQPAHLAPGEVFEYHVARTGRMDRRTPY